MSNELAKHHVLPELLWRTEVELKLQAVVADVVPTSGRSSSSQLLIASTTRSTMVKHIWAARPDGCG